MKILVTTSTLKQDLDDPSPEFINNLVDGLASINPKSEFIYIYPFKRKYPKSKNLKNVSYKPYRYWITSKGHNILDKGLYQSIKSSKFNLIKIFFLIVSQLIYTLYLTIKIKPDYIYAHWIFPQAFVAAIISKITKTKLVFTSHGSDITLLRKLNFIGKLILKFSISNALRITVVSEKNLKKIGDFINIEKHKKKFKVIPMGVSKKFFEQLSTKNQPLSEKKDFLYYGRLTKYKGVDLLIRSFKEINKNYPNTRLKIIGYGDTLKELKNFVKINKLDRNIEFLPFQNVEEIIKEIDKSNLVIVPSIDTGYEFEAGPLTIVESMARKRLCLVSDSVGFISYLDVSTALIFNSGNQQSLTKGIEAFFNLDNESHLNILTNAYKLSEKFKFKEIAAKHNDFLFYDGVR
tara:strand:+ start:3758 stop:4972 length:1215 start_codon:yes stop_codon:yes gene_type:complete